MRISVICQVRRQLLLIKLAKKKFYTFWILYNSIQSDCSIPHLSILVPWQISVTKYNQDFFCTMQMDSAYLPLRYLLPAWAGNGTPFRPSD